MKLPFFKKKEKPQSDVPMIKQQIIPKGVSPVVRPKEEIYKQARMRTRVPEEYMKIELSDKALHFLRARRLRPDGQVSGRDGKGSARREGRPCDAADLLHLRGRACAER